MTLPLTSPTDHVDDPAAGVSCLFRGGPAVGVGGGRSFSPHLLGWALPVEVAMAYRERGLIYLCHLQSLHRVGDVRQSQYHLLISCLGEDLLLDVGVAVLGVFRW